jgi:hypothetical protein
MFQNKIDELRAGLRPAMRVSFVALAIALVALVAFCFLCAAAFIALLDRYGAIEACLAFAGAFLILALLFAIWYAILKRRAPKPQIAAKSAVQAAISDPMVVAAGLQIVRAIGIKKLIPIIAIGGVALGLMASASSSQRKNNPLR